ncbi:MAG: acyl-CoA thioesterase [Ignavibacteriaceae bacterium]|nr:acyl-CoA thioesterase [Ignavibacteriaceae bacterium]
MSQSHEKFDLKITVSENDIDILNHVNNVTYLKWVQDAAVAHWNSAATKAQKESIVWVVVRHEIDYKLQAVLGDELIVRTWVGVSAKNRFERLTDIIRAHDGKLLASARTFWYPVDKLTHRPVRAGEDIISMWSNNLLSV